MKFDEETSTQERPAAPRATKDRTRAYLTILAGTNVGEMVQLDRPTLVLGRSAEADLRLFDDGISRRHAQIDATTEGFAVVDLESRNGTSVNGEKITRRVLEDGDKLQLGETILKFAYHDPLDQRFHQLMIESAMRDALTGAYNRKYFADRIESEFRFATRHKAPLSLILLDLDHFKAVNDTHGHVVGDVVLRLIATRLFAGIRTEDVLCRYGGEEFAILCRATPPEQAMLLAERLRRAIEGEQLVHGDITLRATVSVGVSGLPDHPAASAMQLFGVADQALYGVKRDGRNKVQLGTLDPPTAAPASADEP